MLYVIKCIICHPPPGVRYIVGILFVIIFVVRVVKRWGSVVIFVFIMATFVLVVAVELDRERRRFPVGSGERDKCTRDKAGEVTRRIVTM